MADVQNGVKSPGPEKAAKRITMFKNGEAHFPGKKIVVSVKLYRTYEQFLLSLSNDIKLNSGAVRKVYTAEGKPIASLDDFVEGKNYVAGGPEGFKKAAYPFNAASQAEAGHAENGDEKPKPGSQRPAAKKPDQHAEPAEEEKPIFSASAPNVVWKIHIFMNGDTKKSVKMSINYRNCRTFEMLIQEINNTVKPLTSAVRKLYDPSSGNRIANLQQLHDGINIVAVQGNDPFRKLDYYLVSPDVVADADKANADKQDEARHVTFFPNGNANYAGLKLSVTRAKFPDLEKLFAYLNVHLDILTGSIKRLYALDSGRRIPDISKLENNGAYIAVPGVDPLSRIKYSFNGGTAPPSLPAGNGAEEGGEGHLMSPRITKRILEPKKTALIKTDPEAGDNGQGDAFQPKSNKVGPAKAKIPDKRKPLKKPNGMLSPDPEAPKRNGSAQREISEAQVVEEEKFAEPATVSSDALNHEVQESEVVDETQAATVEV